MSDVDRESERERKLFLGGLNYATTEEGLRQHFEKWGNLVDVVVMRFPDTKRSRGFGFITFETVEEANQCFEDRPHVLDEANVETKRATPRDNGGGRGGRGGSRGGQSDGPQGGSAEFGTLEAHRKLFVGGLDYSTTDESLREYFGKFGNLTDCVVMKFRDTKRSRGFGFITFDNVDSVDQVQNSRPHTVDNAKVETKRATPRDNNQPQQGQQGGDNLQNTKKVFLGGLKDAHTDEALREYFSQFGAIRLLEQLMDKQTGRKRGFGFVEFEDYDPVDKLMLQPGHNIANWRLDVKRAVSKEEMRGPGGGGGGGRMMGGGGGGRRGDDGGYNAPWAGRGGGGGGDHHGGFGGGFGGGQGQQGGAWGSQGGGGGNGYGFNSAFGRGGGGGGGGNPSPWGGNSWEDQGGWGYGGGQQQQQHAAPQDQFGGGYGRAGGGAMRNPPMQNRSAPYNVGGGGGGGGRGGYGGGASGSGQQGAGW